MSLLISLVYFIKDKFNFTLKVILWYFCCMIEGKRKGVVDVKLPKKNGADRSQILSWEQVAMISIKFF